MRIGILGNGSMAEALGGPWAKAGHELFVGGRSVERARKVGDRIGARGGTLQQAAEFGEVVLLAVPAEAAVATVRALELGNSTLIDCTNAINHPGITLAVDAMAETISRYAGQARVVKAFNLAADSVWRRAPLS